VYLIFRRIVSSFYELSLTVQFTKIMCYQCRRTWGCTFLGQNLGKFG